MGENQTVRKLTAIEKGGSIKDIDFLLDCLLNENSEIVKRSFDILVDIKVKSANKIIINKINDSKYNKVTNLIVSICWQSGLDFSDYILLFINVIIKEDIEIAIEAMSVLENIISNNSYSTDLLKEGINMLRIYIEGTNNEVKKLMILDFINMYEVR